MKKLSIIIVDDSQAVCDRLSEEINCFPEFEVIKTIVNPLTAVEEIGRLKPDILLLDTVMSELDGDDILEMLCGGLKHNMGIIVLSPINNDMTISRYSELGAHYFVSKPVNTERLIRKIRMLRENLLREGEARAGSVPIEIGVSSKNLTSKITKLLLQAGVSPKLKGFCFIRESVSFVCSNGNELPSVTKNVYPKIAAEYGTEPEKVERAIRTAIEKAFLSAEGRNFYYETLCPGYASNPGRQYPSNREFIFTFVEYIMNIEPVDMIG